MRSNSILFAVLSGFFLLGGIAYTIWSLLFNAQGIAQNTAATGNGISTAPHVEWVGTVALFLTAILSGLIAFYLRLSYRSQGGELPQDRLDANVDDGDPEMGFFSPWSWWPFVLGFSLAIVSLGLAVGTWIVYIGLAVLPVAITGLIFEYYRGNFAR